MTEGCVAWTLNVHQSYCWLKSDDSNKGEAEGWTTGIKACGLNYESWDCETCQAHDGFTYCQWPDQFNADGGCLPNMNDGLHAPCGEEEGDVIVETCPGTSMSKDYIK